MSFSPFDSALYRDLFGDDEMARLFSDSAEIRAMMLVIGALAKVQGQAGVIPEVSGAFLHRAAMEVQIDPSGLAKATGQNGVTVPGLVAAMRKALEAPEHAGYLHWGATSQDIQDTGLMLRLRQALTLLADRLALTLTRLADLAEQEAESLTAARTYGQIATQSSFGALVAAWGWPFLHHFKEINALRDTGLPVSLSGASGTGTMLGPDPDAIRAALADLLRLRNPGRSWHTDRTAIQDILKPVAALPTAAAKLGEDLLLMTRSDIAEVRLGGVGGSSTMPQKQNPVGPSALVALSRFAAAQMAGLTGLAHAEARDGAAWFAEWLLTPSVFASSGKSLLITNTLLDNLHVSHEAMRAQAIDPLGLIHAEALSFALAARMPRAEAQAAVKKLAQIARDTQRPLPDLVKAQYPDVTLPATVNMGTAPQDARAFAAAARAAIKAG